MSGVLAEGWSDRPWWWDHAPPEDAPAEAPPPGADVVVIGSGYTGLHAALRLARAGREVVVLDKGAIGSGCSTRNGGQVSRSIKPGLAALTRRHGAETAARIIADGAASRAYVEEFVAAEGIDCDFRVTGRFHAAHNRAAFAALARQVKDDPDVTLVPREDQRAEIGTGRYHGGAVFHDHAALDPGRYHAGLRRLARAAGVRLHGHCPATALTTDDHGACVTTPLGQIRARDVVIATNGYTGPLSPWHRRRIIPIGSAIIATEELPPALMLKLFPTGRIASDSRRVVYYYRPSPDGRRILFGGCVSAGETGPETAARRLHGVMARLFPELAAYRVTHSWSGLVGYSFDSLAHIGSTGRVHWAMGYCGSGVGMASYLGMKLGLTLLGDPAGRTGLAERAFPTRPLYAGRPWFLPAAVTAYRALDRLGL